MFHIFFLQMANNYYISLTSINRKTEGKKIEEREKEIDVEWEREREPTNKMEMKNIAPHQISFKVNQ